MLSAFTGALTRSLRRRAKAQLGLPSVEDAYVGAVTFVQCVDRHGFPSGTGTGTGYRRRYIPSHPDSISTMNSELAAVMLHEAGQSSM